MRTLYSQGKGNGKLCQIVREAECTSINNDAFILHTLIVHPALQPLTTDYNYSDTHTITTRRPVQLSVALVVMPMRCCRRSPRLVVGSACRERQFSCSLPYLLPFGSLHILGFERAATSIHHPPISPQRAKAPPIHPLRMRFDARRGPATHPSHVLQLHHVPEQRSILSLIVILSPQPFAG